MVRGGGSRLQVPSSGCTAQVCVHSMSVGGDRSLLQDALNICVCVCGAGGVMVRGGGGVGYRSLLQDALHKCVDTA